MSAQPDRNTTETASHSSAAELVTRLMDAYDRTLAEEGGFTRVREAMLAGETFEDVAVRVGGELGSVQRELIHPEIESDYSALGTPTVDTGPVFRGHDGWIQMRRAWLEPWESYEFGRREVEPIDGERALLHTTQVYLGRTSGARVEIDQVGVWTARDGKLVGYRAFDTREEAIASLHRGEAS